MTGGGTVPRQHRRLQVERPAGRLHEQGVGSRPQGRVGREGHAQLERSLPESVVLGAGLSGAVGERAEADGLEAQPVHPVELGQGIVEPAGGDHRIGDQPLGRHRAVVLRQEVVKGADHRHVGLPVLDVLDEPADEDGRVENLGVDAVAVLLGQPLPGVPRARHRRAVRLPVGAALDLERAAGGDVLPVVDQGTALHDPSLAARPELDEPRGPVAVHLGNVAHPWLRRDLQVPVAGDDLVPSGHRARARVQRSGLASKVRGDSARATSTKRARPTSGSRYVRSTTGDPSDQRLSTSTGQPSVQWSGASGEGSAARHGVGHRAPLDHAADEGGIASGSADPATSAAGRGTYRRPGRREAPGTQRVASLRRGVGDDPAAIEHDAVDRGRVRRGESALAHIRGDRVRLAVQRVAEPASVGAAASGTSRRRHHEIPLALMSTCSTEPSPRWTRNWLHAPGSPPAAPDSGIQRRMANIVPGSRRRRGGGS